MVDKKDGIKSIYCEVCKRSYKINYYYTHKNQSKKHKNNLRGKDNLLNDLLEAPEIDNRMRNATVFLEDIKTRIDNFLKNNI